MSDPRIGTRLGAYTIEHLIGRGGMSVVYLAEHARLRRKVALKLITPELASDEEFRDRFLRESETAAAIDHPNIIPIYDADEIDGTLFIAMRYVGGPDLKKLIERDGRLDLGSAIAIVTQIASALDAGHGRGLVHRDVKPANVLIEPQSGRGHHVYLTDFGLTKHRDSQSRLTGTGQFVGTIDYMAPEQIQAQAVDARADIYSLACLAYECLTETPPFERDSDVAVMWAHVQDPPPKISERRADLPPEIDEVFAQALAKDPAARHPSCGAFADALVALSGGRTPLPTVRQEIVTERSGWRRYLPGSLDTAVLLALAAVAVVFLLRADRAPERPDENARDPFAVSIESGVLALDPETLAIEAAIPVEIGASHGGSDNPGEELGNPLSQMVSVGNALYVNRTGGVARIGVTSLEEVNDAFTDLEAPGDYGIGLAAGEGFLWAAAGHTRTEAGGTWIIQIKSLATTPTGVRDTEIQRFRVGTSKALAADDDYLWVCGPPGSGLRRYSYRDLQAGNGSPLVLEDVECNSSGNAITVHGDHVWVVTGSGELVRIDEDETKDVKRVEVADARGVAAGEEGVFVLTSDAATFDSTVVKLDPVTLQLDGEPARLDEGTWIDVGAGGVWVVQKANERVVKLDPETLQVVEEKDLERGPTQVLADPSGVWIAF